MLYTSSHNLAILDNLDERLADIANCILALYSEGYIPNKKKKVKVSWLIALSHCYDNVDIFGIEREEKLNNIRNKIANL